MANYLKLFSAAKHHFSARGPRPKAVKYTPVWGSHGWPFKCGGAPLSREEHLGNILYAAGLFPDRREELLLKARRLACQWDAGLDAV